MNIVADKNIPYLKDYFLLHGSLVTLDVSDINAITLKGADVLLVRSVTNVNKALLQGTQVKFVASASSGADHLDLAYLNQANIHWYTAKGSNALAVTEYVLCCLAALQQQSMLSKQPVIGIVGVGCVGGLLRQYLQALGFEVLAYDPPRAQHEQDFTSVSLSDIAQCDMICLHVPLETSGQYPTHHLIEQSFLRACKPGTVILNASRGAVLDSEAMRFFKDKFIWCLDVWEHEPAIDLELLFLATIATPHIAGHTLEAKQRATERVYQAFCREFNIEPQEPCIKISAVRVNLSGVRSWQDKILSLYNPLQETQVFKQAMLEVKCEAVNQGVDLNTQIAARFHQLRKQQGSRPEFTSLD